MASDTFLPQFDSPFRIDRRGRAAVVEQDTPQEIAVGIYNVIVCPLGAKLGDPSFGIPSPLFASLPLDMTAVLNAVQALEPRVTMTAVRQALDIAGGQEQVTVIGTLRTD